MYDDYLNASAPISEDHRRSLMATFREQGFSDSARHQFAQAVCGKPSSAMWAESDYLLLRDRLAGR